jgi:hypothetical protein
MDPNEPSTSGVHCDIRDMVEDAQLIGANVVARVDVVNTDVNGPGIVLDRCVAKDDTAATVGLDYDLERCVYGDRIGHLRVRCEPVVGQLTPDDFLIRAEEAATSS